MRVVIVDDSADIRDVLRMALERQDDFTVVAEAADGQEAVAVVSAHKPHVVLLDIAMPVMDGLQALPQVKHESPGSIVIMLTGISETAGALSAVEQGAHGYIRKGAAMGDFLAQVREVLETQIERLERTRTRRADPPAGGQSDPGSQ
jgi:DNA-binding NarL/FixJ family response regulator